MIPWLVHRFDDKRSRAQTTVPENFPIPAVRAIANASHPARGAASHRCCAGPSSRANCVSFMVLSSVVSDTTRTVVRFAG
jgi:hypothetical protein